MDLAERIEQTRFLGREFLVWLWFKSELHEANFRRPDGSAMELWLDSQLSLRSVHEPTEQIAFKGVAPSGRVEAKFALQKHWMPVKARVCVTIDAQDFAFVMDADSLAKTAIKLPVLTAKESDERFYERMHLLEVLDTVVEEQFREFLDLRLTNLWEAELVPAVTAWSQGEEALSPQAYRGLLGRAQRAS